MVKVYLVEDEIIIRQSIKNSIDWQIVADRCHGKRKAFSYESQRPFLFKVAMEGDADCGDMMSYGYYSGENITDITEGRPLFVRKPTSRFSLANFNKGAIAVEIRLPQSHWLQAVG